MSLLKRIFGNAEPDPKLQLLPLYNRLVAKAREPHWYIEGQIPDSIDGRFDMVAAMMSLVLLRLEKAPGHGPDMAYLTEIFVDDMDGQLREVGIGEMVVGKHVGKMMGALGGRLTAFRTALADHAQLEGVLLRNLYRADGAETQALAHVRENILATEAALAADIPAAIAAGQGTW